MQEHYAPETLEREIQAHWKENGTFTAKEDPTREKFYCLSMFPYPSGRLHMGHVRNYTIADVIARHQRMLGKNVMQPMGWDAFGLPAENAAIDHNVAPADWTHENIAYMRAQLERLGFAYDWSRELATCDPDYYRWEQWFFTRLMERGVAYRRMAEVNWDPVDQTVLANEQVIDGCGWRSGARVERRQIPQWFLRITDYADELLDAIDGLEAWPEAVRSMQRHWIGRSEGLAVRFPLARLGQVECAGNEGQDEGQKDATTVCGDTPDAAQRDPAQPSERAASAGLMDAAAESIEVFTTRPDTLFGVTYLAVAAEHPLALAEAADNPALEAFIAECRQTSTQEAELETMEKRGHRLAVTVRHPLTDAVLPVFAANFVLAGYGTGAVMSVPAHDQRDWEFARAYGLPMRAVIGAQAEEAPDISEQAFTERGITLDSGPFSGLDFDAAFDAIAGRLEAAGLGERRRQYRLRDWGVSRQRYWGCPIPVAYDANGEALPAPDVPVRLPTDVTLNGISNPLKSDAEFARVTAADGTVLTRETDTFDTFMESSWYYARYCCPDNDAAMLDERARYWLPVDVYVGGIEHAVLHLLYSRFFHKLLRDAGLVDCDEPYRRLLTQGMVCAETFYRERPGARREFFAPDEVVVETDDKGRIVGAHAHRDGEPVTVGPVEKMSKSKRNGVDPEGLIARYGADTVRLYTMFAAPPEQTLEWSASGVEGAFRFIKRLWRLVFEHVDAASGACPDPASLELDRDSQALRRIVHRTIEKVSDDYARRYHFNTAIAAVMELVNALSRAPRETVAQRAVLHEGIETAVLLLAPIIPHAGEAMWAGLGHGPVCDADWPKTDRSALVADETLWVVQVNGKKRAELTLTAGLAATEVEAAALTEPNVMRNVGDKTVRKVVVVEKRALINIVVG